MRLGLGVRQPHHGLWIERQQVAVGLQARERNQRVSQRLVILCALGVKDANYSLIAKYAKLKSVSTFAPSYQIIVLSTKVPSLR